MQVSQITGGYLVSWIETWRFIKRRPTKDQLSYGALIVIAVLFIILEVLQINSIQKEYESEKVEIQTEHSESELFQTTSDTARAVYDVASVFKGSTEMQEYVDEYGQNRMGVYMLSTSEDKKQLKKYTYSDMQERVQAKPVSLICVYQTQSRDWVVFYPVQLYNILSDPKGYLDRIQQLLDKIDIANSYANIINYTYELYPDLNQRIADKAQQVSTDQISSKYLIKVLLKTVIQLTISIMVGLCINWIIDYVDRQIIYTSATIEAEHKRDRQKRLKREQEHSRVNNEVDRSGRHLEAERPDNRVNNTESRNYTNVTKQQDTNNSIDRQNKKQISLLNLSERLIDGIDGLENSNSELQTAETDSLKKNLKILQTCLNDPEKKNNEYLIKFYSQYFRPLYSIASQTNKMIQDENISTESKMSYIEQFKQAIILYNEITSKILDNILNQKQNSIDLYIKKIQKIAESDGLIEIQADQESVGEISLDIEHQTQKDQEDRHKIMGNKPQKISRS